MKADQLIYTSCKRGISGNSSGFQIFSYSPAIPRLEANNQLGTLFAQFNGQTMPSNLPYLPTPEEAKSLFPKRYRFQRFSGTDPLCGMSLCTYIGRDYPENSQRAGNFLAHCLVFSAASCDVNPGRLLCSKSFTSWIDPVVFRKDECPETLPQVDLVPSKDIDWDTISDFLCEGYRGDIYRQMLGCLLNARDEQHNRTKRIFIHDSPENIPLWIASLMMAFPTPTALGISFSTYEYEPESSSSNIVGTAEHTGYSVSKHTLGNDFYFDIFENVFDSSSFDDTHEYCDFVCDSLMYSHENILSFHDFLSKFTYTAADKRLADAYNLYFLVQGTFGFDDYSVDQIGAFLSFAEEFSNIPFLISLSNNILQYLHAIDIPDDMFNVLFGFIQKLTSSGSINKAKVTDEITKICFEHFCNNNVGNSKFHKIYNRFDKNIEHDLGKRFLAYAESLSPDMWSGSQNAWRAAFIVHLCAVDKNAVQQFLVKDSFYYSVLQIVLIDLSPKSQEEIVDIVKYLFSEYEHVGSSRLTTLYLATKLSATGPSMARALKAFECGFLWSLSFYTDEEVVSALQILYKNGIEDDLKRQVKKVYEDSSRDFLSFVKLIENKIPSYFSTYRQNLIPQCFNKARNISGSYNVFAFAANTGKFSPEEMEDFLSHATQYIAILNIPESHLQYIHGFCNYCTREALPFPERLLLANLTITLNEVFKTSGKLFASDKKYAKTINYLNRSEPIRVFMLNAEERHRYLVEIAKAIAILLDKSDSFELQENLFVPDPETQHFFAIEIFRNVCINSKKSRDYTTLAYLIIYDAFVHQAIFRRLLNLLNQYGITSSALSKCIEKEKDGLSDYFDSINRRNTETFDIFIGKILDSIEPDQGSSFFGSVKDGMRGLFKKNRED